MWRIWMMKEKIMKIKSFLKENIWLSVALMIVLMIVFAFVWKWSLDMAYRWGLYLQTSKGGCCSTSVWRSVYEDYLMFRFVRRLVSKYFKPFRLKYFRGFLNIGCIRSNKVFRKIFMNTFSFFCKTFPIFFVCIPAHFL